MISIITLSQRLRQHVPGHKTGHRKTDATCGLRQHPHRIDDGMQQPEYAGHSKQPHGNRCGRRGQYVQQADDQMDGNVLEIVAVGSPGALHIRLAKAHGDVVHGGIFGIRICLNGINGMNLLINKYYW